MIDVEKSLKKYAESIAPPKLDGEQMLNKFKTPKARRAFRKKYESTVPFWRSTVAKVTAAVILLSVIIPTGITLYSLFGKNLDRMVEKLRDTFVDMDGVVAFAVWNAPDDTSGGKKLSQVNYITAYADGLKEGVEGDDEGVDEELYDFESDYDWDPTKANVLVSIDEDGKIKEVVYERTNNRGMVRQDILGNAAMVYVAKDYTYVLYVDDDTWDFWKMGDFAQSAVRYRPFTCHHAKEQTIVIHNATGKVFALKDVLPQVNDNSGVFNYTFSAVPTYDGYVVACPHYGNSHEYQWYDVVYDEETEKIRYDFVYFEDEAIAPFNYKIQGVNAVKKDKYGQEYILANNISFFINLSNGFKTNGNKLVYDQFDFILYGTDNRMYVKTDGKLKVFGEGFELTPVEEGTCVSLESVVDYYNVAKQYLTYRVYHLEDGYLYSAFGEVWKIESDGQMVEQAKLVGEFPNFPRDANLIGGEIIAVTCTKVGPYDYLYYGGKVVRLTFGLVDGVPSVKSEEIMTATEIKVVNYRMIVRQGEFNEKGWHVGGQEYYLLQVNDGVISVEHIASGLDGGVTSVVKPVTEPLKLN